MKIDEQKLKKILELWENGLSRNQIKKIVHMSSDTINYYLLESVGQEEIKKNAQRQYHKAATLTAIKRYGTSAIDTFERNKLILTLRKQGKKLREIAAMFDMSEVHVSRIINDYIFRKRENEREETRREEALEAQRRQRRKEQEEQRKMRIAEAVNRSKSKNLAKRAEMIYKKMMRFAEQGDTQSFLRLRSEYANVQMRLEFENNMKNETMRNWAVAQSVAKSVNFAFND